MPIIDNDKHLIGDLLSSRNPFVIPKHQRAYSWEREEVESFCTDINNVGDEYFFGGVVSVFEHAQNTPGRIYKVVDGQQRLATFTIFLKCIVRGLNKVKSKRGITAEDRDYAEDIIKETNDKYIQYRDTRRRPVVDVYRVTLSKIDKDYFVDLLDEKNPETLAISHKRLKRAYDTIYRMLIKPIIEDNSIENIVKIEKLIKKRDQLLNHSLVIHVVTDNVDEAYQLFEVLNDRGKDLAIGDYLRSSTLELLGDDEYMVERVSSFWDDVLSCDYADKYLRNYLSSYQGQVKRTNVHRQFRKKFFEADDITNQIILDRVSNLSSQMKIHDKLLLGQWPFENSELNQWQRSRLSILVSELKHTHCIPLLMCIYEHVDERTFFKTIQSIEKFVFRYIKVGGNRANRLSQIYYSTIQAVRKGEEFDITSFNDGLKKILDEVMSNKMFKLKLLELNYSENTITTIRYFLTTIEYYFRSYHRGERGQQLIPDMGRIILIDNNDIEHIYPQNPETKDDRLEILKHDIGNLSFWGIEDNRSKGNKLFNDKVDFYRDSSVAITRILAEEKFWGEQNIINRRNLFVEMALEIF